MQYDLIIRNGTVIDGSGLPRFRADVGIVHGKIAAIGAPKYCEYPAVLVRTVLDNRELFFT